MKSLEEFRAFWKKDLQDTLSPLDQHRKRVIRKYLYLIPMVLIGLGVGIVFTPIGIIPAAGVIAFYYWLGPYRAEEAFNKSFKETLIKPIIKFIDGGLIYRPNYCIKEQAFNFSNIFGSHTDYDGDDYVSGKIGKTTIEFSELNVEKRLNKQTITVFKGLFLIADFHKNFKGETYVLTDKAESAFGKFGTTLQSINFSRPPLVKLEDPEFEKHFVVYASDQVEARYILSPSFMERILQLKVKTKSTIQMSFHRSKIFLAIPTYKEFLAPSLGNSLHEGERLEEYFTDINAVLEVVEDLSLNTRIWSKS